MRGRVAFALATAAVLLTLAAVVQAATYAAVGAWGLVIGPAIGLAIACGVWAALRRACSTGSRAADLGALWLIVLLGVVGFFGVSFGGLYLVVPMLVLMAAHAATPVPR